MVARVSGKHEAAAPTREVTAVLLAGLQNQRHGGGAEGVCCVYLKLVLGELGDEAVGGAEELVGGVGKGVLFVKEVCIHEGRRLIKRLESAFGEVQGAHGADGGEVLRVKGICAGNDEAGEVALLGDAGGVLWCLIGRDGEVGVGR